MIASSLYTILDYKGFIVMIYFRIVGETGRIVVNEDILGALKLTSVG